MSPSEYLRSISRTVVRQKFCLSRNDSGVWGDDFDDDGTIVLRSTEVALDGSWRIDDPAVRKLTPTERRKGLLEAGDLVVTTSSGSRKHIGKTAVVDESVAALGCAFSNFMQRLRVKGGHDPRFFGYLLNAPLGREQMFYLGSTTTGLMNLNGTVIGDIEIPDTHPSTQKAIADFLDKKTAAIDALIEKKQKLLTLLAEKRAALINQAVTKGLDPNVPMKDSGIPWIGEIPAHWEVKRLKTACTRVVVGIAEAATHAYTESGGVPIVRSTNLRPNHIQTDDLLMVEPWFAQSNQSKFVFARDLLTQRTGEYSGMTAPVPASLDRCQCFTMVISTPRPGFNSEFLSLFLNSAGETYWDLNRWGSAQPNISVPIVKEAPIPCPPREDQDGVVERLRQSARTDPAPKVRAQLDKLREYRRALITAAVTGQLDIGEAA